MIIDDLTPTVLDNLTDEIPVEQGTATLKTTWQKALNLFASSAGTPLMDGTASTGSASAFSRSDHRHPTDTSRASQTDMTAAQGDITAAQGDITNLLLSLPQTEYGDANSITGTYQQIIKINGTTANTPYTEGLTQSTAGMIISYANSSTGLYCSQLCIMCGDPTLFVRVKNNGTWGSWQTTPTDSDWHNVSLTADFKEYSTNVLPKYRKIGGIVNVHGIVKPSASIAGSNDLIAIFTLPLGYRPSENIVTVCQGSGNCVWAMTVASSGVCSFSRYRDGTGLQPAGTSTWLPFNVTFMVG